MKKKFLNLILVLFVILLTSCSGGNNEKFEITDKFILENMEDLSANPSKNTFAHFDMITDFTLTTTNLNNGIMVVTKLTNEKSIYSVVKGDYLFPFERDISFSYITRNLPNGEKAFYIIKSNTFTKKNVIYDVKGNVLLEYSNDENYTLNVNYILKYDLFGKEVSKYYLETIIHHKSDGSTAKKEFKIDYYTREREEVESNDDYYGKIEKSELTTIGLKDYYGYFYLDRLYIYDKDDNFISSFKPEESSIAGFIVNGKVVYQSSFEVGSESNDYTYIENGIKYKLISKQVDLLTGKEKSLKLNYVIEDFDPIKDENGDYVYALASIRKIEEKNIQATEVNVILNSDGKILKELDISSFKSIRVVDDVYVDAFRGIIYDKNFGPLLKFSTIHSVSKTEKLIFASMLSKSGAIDKTGKVIIPFNYTFQNTDFVDGKIYAKDSSGNHFLIDATGQVEELPSSTQKVSDGLLVTFSNEGLNSTATFINHKKETIYEATYYGQNYYNYLVKNLYGNYQVYFFLDQGNKYDLVYFDISPR